MLPTIDPWREIASEFAARFGAEPIIVQAPGRVNLIGEHTDYNDGLVMPAAIQFHTAVAIADRCDGRVVIASENYGEQVEFAIAEFPRSARHHWSDYVVGVASKLKEAGIQVRGASMLIQGGVPQGAGLSSSASLEVAVCRALLEVTGEHLGGAETALLCQRAENEFVGARCGIMDQFVSVHGRRDHALRLDCRSLQYSHEPLPDEVRLVICNTMVRHSLADGEYNQRRQECETGARLLAGRIPGVKALRDVSMQQFEEYQASLPETVSKRCRHVISENERVNDAANALSEGDLARFGDLMRESHNSLRNDFDVSCRELDAMVELASKVDGVYGARMTGGGFGGCTINLVQFDYVENFRRTMAEGYEKLIGHCPEIYVCTAAEGVKRVQ